MTMTTTQRIQSRLLLPTTTLLSAWSMGSVVARGVSEKVRINRKDTYGGEVSG
jgi:hypothetical protein